MTPERPADDELEHKLRAALHARADSTQIVGDGLTLIRDRVQGRRRSRAWTPLLAGAAATAVIVGIAVVPKVISSPDADSAAAGSPDATVSTADASILVQPSASTVPAPPDTGSSTSAPDPTTAPTSAPSSAPDYTGDPLPVSADTLLVYPYANAEDLSGALEQPDPDGVLSGDAGEVATRFVRLATGGTATYTAVSSQPSAGVVAGSDGVLVTVADQAGNVVTNVYLRAVVTDDQVAYGVVGASRDGGDQADLTVDPPEQTASTITFSGRYSADLAGSNDLTITVLQIGASIELGQNYPQVQSVEDRWSVQVPVPSDAGIAGVLGVTRLGNGVVTALVATTVSP